MQGTWLTNISLLLCLHSSTPSLLQPTYTALWISSGDLVGSPYTCPDRGADTSIAKAGGLKDSQCHGTVDLQATLGA